MVLNLPQDGSMLGLSGDNVLLMSMKGCHLLSQDALRSGQCLQSVTCLSGMVLPCNPNYPQWVAE